MKDFLIPRELKPPFRFSCHFFCWFQVS